MHTKSTQEEPRLAGLSAGWIGIDRTYENQQDRASRLNLLVTAMILWNTRHLECDVATLRQTEDVPDQLLAHLSLLGWERVNLTED
jgi:Tn3 transposase DDE domain